MIIDYERTESSCPPADREWKKGNGLVAIRTPGGRRGYCLLLWEKRRIPVPTMIVRRLFGRGGSVSIAKLTFLISESIPGGRAPSFFFPRRLLKL